MAEKTPSEATPCLAAAVMSPVPSTSKTGNTEARIQRNVAEKQRRDKLNGYISELANIVPMVSMSSKRLDKTSILRLSAAHLRICKSSLSGSKKQKKAGFKWCPSFLNDDQVRDILESVDGFLLLTTGNAKVLFTSRSVERYLGHQDIDMIGHSLFTFIHPDDLDTVKDETEKVFSAAKERDDKQQHRCSFRCRMREKGQPRSEVVTYQYVHLVGHVTACEQGNEENAPKNVASYMLKAFIKVVDISPYNQLSLEEATADEYVTRHSLDGTIIFADHRLATITGHMPHEVVGLSAYHYIHSSDTDVTLFAHHLMFSNDKGTGMIVYRLRTRNDKFVYLKSVGCLQFDAATSQVDHFVCVNQHLSDTDGDLQLKYFVDRFIPHIRGSSTSTLFESVKALQTSSGKSLPSADKAIPHILKDNLSSPKAELNVTGSGIHKPQHNGSQISRKDFSFGSIKVENQESMIKALPSNGKIHGSMNMPNSSNGQFGIESGGIGGEPGSKLQRSGTNVSYTISAADAEYFSKTIHKSSSKDIDTIYVSSLDSTLSIYKNSTNSSLKDELLKRDSENSCVSNVQPNGTKSTKVNGIKMAGGNSNEKTSNGCLEECLSRSNDQFGSSEAFEKDADAKLSSGQPSFVHGQHSTHTEGLEYSREFSEEGLSRSNDQFKSSPMEQEFETDADVKASVGQQSFHHRLLSTHADTDCESPFPVEFMDSRGPISTNHSRLIKSEEMNSPLLSLSSSKAVLHNSMWSMADCEMKDSSMEDLSFVDASDDAKDGLTYQEDFSLLSSTLSQADSSPANGWNDVFSLSNYPSDSTKDSQSGFS